MMKFILHMLGFNYAPIQTLESVRLELAWGWATLILLLLIFLPMFFWFYRLEDKPCPPTLSRVLLGLRLLFIAGILALLAGPRFQVSGMVPQKNKLAVLIDTSRSMSIKEDGISRMERAQEALGKGFLFKSLESQTGVAPSIFSFSGQVAPLSREEISSSSLVPDGDQTNLTRAISEVSANLGAGNLLGIVLLTDGAHNHGDSPLDVIPGLRIPLFFLGTGKSGLVKDLSVSLERPPAIGFLNSKVRIRGELRAYQVASTSIPVEVKRDGKPFDTIAVAIAPGENRANFNLNIPCDVEGQFNFSVSVPRLDGELTHDNNETGFLLKVVKERLKILVLSNGPSWDLNFIKGAAKSDVNAFLNGFTRVTENRWLTTENFVQKGMQAVPNFGPDLEEADVVIIRGIPEPLLRPYWDNLKKRIETGKTGVLILPGTEGYSALGYTGSPLAEMFPVELAGENWKASPCNISLPSREGLYAFLRLLDDPLENQEFYRTLPRWEGLYTYSQTKTGAEVLLNSGIETSNRIAPALVQHRLGRGNVAMLTGGPIWPMGFKLVPTGKGIKPYTAFVLNLLKWLANRREDAQVVLELPSSRAFVGQPTTLRVWVSDTRRQPVDSAQVTGTISSQNTEPTRLAFVATQEKGCYETTFVPPRRGKIDIQVEAGFQGQQLGEAKGQLLVEMPTAEFDNPEVRVDLMSQLASITGGVYLPSNQSQDLSKLIKATPGQKRETKILEVRDNAWVLAFLLTLPVLEWIFRRRKGFS